jgi:hypothetical protein
MRGRPSRSTHPTRRRCQPRFRLPPLLESRSQLRWSSRHCRLHWPCTTMAPREPGSRRAPIRARSYGPGCTDTSRRRTRRFGPAHTQFPLPMESRTDIAASPTPPCRPMLSRSTPRHSSLRRSRLHSIRHRSRGCPSQCWSRCHSRRLRLPRRRSRSLRWRARRSTGSCWLRLRSHNPGRRAGRRSGSASRSFGSLR